MSIRSCQIRQVKLKRDKSVLSQHHCFGTSLRVPSFDNNHVNIKEFFAGRKQIITTGIFVQHCCPTKKITFFTLLKQIWKTFFLY